MCKEVTRKDLTMDELYECTERLIWKIVNGYSNNRNPRFETWDLFQEGWIAVQSAYDRWDPEKGPFKNLAYPYIDGKIKCYIGVNYSSLSSRASRLWDERHEGREVPLPCSLSDTMFEENEAKTREDTLMYIEHGFENIEAEDIIKNAKLACPKSKKSFNIWYDHYINELTRREIIEKYGISKQRVSQHILAINKELEKIYGGKQ